MTGKYVVIDGMDGAGKGKQIELLKQKLGSNAIFTREPGGTELGEHIRQQLLGPEAKQLSPFTQLSLFLSARSDVRTRIVAPALEEGKIVVSDRSDSSTFAFQLHGEEWMSRFGWLFFATRCLMQPLPDLYLILDLPAEVARERAIRGADRGQANHYDVRDLAFYERVRDGFRRFADIGAVEFIDANRPVEQVHRSVMMALTARMITPEYAFFIE